jgi:phytoene synthase
MRADAASGLLAAQAHCRAVTLRSGSSFAAAFWMFPKRERQAVHAIYAFCRFADDLADDPHVSGSRALLLERWRAELFAAYQGVPTHPVGIALADAVRRFDLPREIFEELLRGVESDLERAPMETFDEVTRYCFRVASTVGILLVRLLGHRSPRALAYAEAMGIAVQLTNILRDVGEDAAAGRIYLAREDMRRFDVSAESLSADPTPDELRVLLACYAERARLYYERAARLRPEDGRDRLRPADAMGRIYRAQLEELQRRHFPLAPPAPRLSNARRLAITASVWLEGARA